MIRFFRIGGRMGGESVLPEDAFPAAESVPGQRRSREIYAAVEGTLRTYTWWPRYLELRALKLDWRKAAWVAWMATPAAGREPATQSALADLLGINDRTIRGWRQRQPDLDQIVAAYQLAPLVEHRADVVGALIASASTPAPQHSADRKLFFQLTGDLEEKAQQRLVGSDSEPPLHIYLPDNGRDTDHPTPAGSTDDVAGKPG